MTRATAGGYHGPMTGELLGSPAPDPAQLSMSHSSLVPVAESPADVIHHTRPAGKTVLSVAGFGYPLAFLAHGAARVLGFDVDPYFVAWQHFLRGAIAALDHDEHRRLLLGMGGRAQLQALKRRALRGIEPAYRALAASALADLVARQTPPRELARHYPQLRGSRLYGRLRAAIAAGRWEIRQGELLALLGQIHAEQPDRRFDVAYISSIRNWVAFHLYRLVAGHPAPEAQARFQREYDEPLGRLLTAQVAPGGVVYESLIRLPFFPQQPLAWPGLRTRLHVARRAASGHGIVLGRKPPLRRRRASRSSGGSPGTRRSRPRSRSRP